MARNSNGTFTLAAGNPVVEDTTIEPDWANDTLNDIAAELTDSLSRSGKGGMLVPMEFADGTVGDPAITFSAAPTTGLYRAGTNDVRFSLAGVDLITLTTALIKFVARVADGASAVGLTLDTANALTTTGAKLVSLLNNAVEKFYVDKDGGVAAGGNITSATALFSTLEALGATLKGNVADGATAVAIILDNVNALANAAAKALSVRVGGVEKAYVSNVGKGFFVGLDAGSGNIANLSAPSAAGDVMRYGDSFAAPTIVRPSIAAGWTNGTGGLAVGYWKDANNIIHLMGIARYATGASSVLFTLPTGFRPASSRLVSMIEGVDSYYTPGDRPIACQIDASGSVSVRRSAGLGAPTDTFYYIFDGVTFLAE